MHKDEITGNEVIDYDFLGKKLYPPRKLKMTDAGKEIAALFRELDRMYYPSKNKSHDFSANYRRSGGSTAYKQPCVVKMYYTDSKKKSYRISSQLYASGKQERSYR